MKKLRVMALMHGDLVPPDTLEGASEKAREEWRTEYDVCAALHALGHEVLKLGIKDEILPIRQALAEWKPDIAFNLLEEFAEQALWDQHVVAYLEMLRLPYTGCNPRGLMLSRDKSLCKKVLLYHHIRVPEFAVFELDRKVKRPRRMKFPLIVKSLIEDASLGIAQASIVDNDEKLVERVRFIHEKIQTDALVERYIAGRELYVGVLGNRQLQVLPTWEMLFQNKAPDAENIATAKVKWDKSYQTARGIVTRAAESIAPKLAQRIADVSRGIYRVLGLSGYARMDFRLNENGELYFLEANPNPQIARSEDLADSAQAAGISYEELIQKILSMGLRRGS